MTILGIESSCDETSAAVCRNGKIINNIIATQEVHKRYGGVIPELASRAHVQNIIPVIENALSDANISLNAINAIAYTQGPGLLGALLVGSSMAKSLALSLKIPVIPIHHMKAHILVHFIEKPKPDFPFLCLTVSGGHTQIVKVNSINNMTILGQTIDDAVGEAFDKVAKMLGLPYPGGPLIDTYATQGDASIFQFAKADVPDFNYSFSGIKTSILYFLKKKTSINAEFIKENIHNICASVQFTLIEMLMDKFLKAAKSENIQQLAIAGGVAANSRLRKTLEKTKKEGYQIFIPDFQYCSDNAAMIAMAGHFLAQEGKFGELNDSPLPRMPF